MGLFYSRKVGWAVGVSCAWVGLALGYAANALADSPWPDQACPESIPSSLTRKQRISQMVQTMRSTLERTSPYVGSVGGGVFSGNYDWHSSVHNHWALLSIARVTGRKSVEKQVLKRLTPEALARERDYLNSNPSFELPYGQSWLLVMLDELGRRSQIQETHQFRTLQRDTRDRVVSWLESSSFPEAGGLTGAHSSWLFSFQLALISARDNQPLKDRLFQLWLSKVNPAREAIANFQPSDWDFLDLRGVLGAVDHLISTESSLLPVGPASAFKSPIVSSNAHTAGAAMVKIWPYALQSHQDPASCARFQTRMSEMFSRPDQWRDGFETVAHWVPQFMWMGLWLEAGRP